jgi:hypothetical protein
MNVLEGGAEIVPKDDRPVLTGYLAGAEPLFDSLFDQYTLLVFPLVLGTGKRMFPDGIAPAKLTLLGAETSTTRVVVLEYAANVIRRGRSSHRPHPCLGPAPEPPMVRAPAIPADVTLRDDCCLMDAERLDRGDR